MTPASLPLDVIASVQMSPLISALGYVTVDGFWQEMGRPATRWRERKKPVTAWTLVKAPVTRDWEG